MKSRAQSDPTQVSNENYTTLGLTDAYVGYYAITNAEDLAWVQNKVSTENATYKNMKVVLTADIDLSGIATWTPIGSETAKFMGIFDGNGHSITGMSILNYTESYQGLFAWVEGTANNNRAVLKNFSLSGTMTSSTNGPDYIGGVVGRCANYTDLIDVTNNVNITIAAGIAQNHMGGVAGWCQNTTMTRCVNNGNIDAGATSNCVAGVMGYGTTASSLTNCVNYGSISSTADNAYIAGLLGYIDNTKFAGAHSCLNIGTITGGSANTYAGAIYGQYGQKAATKSTNNYYLSTSASKAYGANGSTDNLNNVITSVTAEQLASGEVCFLLNGDQSNIAWYQTIGTDATPTLDENRDQVYYNSKLCDSNGVWTGRYIAPYNYSNTENIIYDDEQCQQYVENKAVLNNGTLTFYRDYIKHDGTTYSMNFYKNRPDWSSNSSITSVVFDPSFASARPSSCYGWFYCLFYLTSITGIENLNTENVQYMGYMFYGCSKLTSLDLSSFNTAKVTEMDYMFHNCNKLTSLDLSSFNTEKVTNMTYMFRGCKELTSLDLSNFNTAKVTNMSYMFDECSKLASLNVRSFNTGNVKDMSIMFYSCSALASLDLSNFNTAKVTTMGSMFSGCSALASLDLSNFNTANVTNMTQMYDNCSNLTSLDLSNFNTANVTNMGYMFRGCSNLSSLTIGNFDMQKVTNVNSMFNNSSALTTLTMKSVPFLTDQTFNTQFSGPGVTVNYELDDNSVIYTGENYLPAATSAPTYTRNIAATSDWGTLVLPFEAKSDANVQLYTLSAASGENLTFTPAETVAANTPCVFKKKVADATSVVFTANTVAAPAAAAIAATAEVDGLSMNGTYTALSNQTGMYFIAQNKFWLAENPITLNPFRAWFEGNLGASASARLDIVENTETVTSLDAIDVNTNATKVMIDGQMFILKNGQMFDMSGRKIK